MKKFALSLLFAGVSVIAMGVRRPDHASRTMLKISDAEFRAHQAEIRAGDLDIAGVDPRAHSVFLLVTSDERKFVDRLGLRFEVQKETHLFSDSPDPKFKTPDQVATILNGMVSSHPDLATLVTVGKSLENRPILALKLTKSGSPTPKPSVFFNGMHHAREVMSAEVPLDIAQTLLDGYGKDAKITHWLETYEVYVLPMLNPDGNNKVWNDDNMWRKNARSPSGVDINRNYPYAWNSCSGSSGSEDAEDYRGPSAASEPETQAMMNFVTAIHPTFSISFHSFSEVVMYPYGCGGHVQTSSVVEPIGKMMGSLIPTDDGNGTYTVGNPAEIMYDVDGDDIDWMYHEQSVIPYVIEVNSSTQGFQPGFDDWRESTVSRLRPAWQYLLARMDGSSIRGLIHAAGASGASRIHVQGKGAVAAFTQDAISGTDGRYDLILDPGDYDLTFNNSGKQISKSVHVDAAAVTLDVNL